LAGVVGSKIASELGNMRISEQIDALEIMGINTKSYLVMPKVLGSLIVIPCLIVISAVLAIWGGRVAGSLTGILANDIYDIGLRQNLNLYNIKVAFYKAYTFGFLISSIPAYYGFNVKGGALEIGRASTSAVVVTCILILLADYILAALLL
jgi:phospholipid/cholesterol/gamma-HCH transport system permease protein